MDEKHKELLKFHRTRFLQCVDIDRLIPLLQTNGVLSNDDVTDLRKYSSSGAKAEKLLDLLPSKGSQAFQAFCLALENTYPHLLTVMFLGGSKKMSGECLGDSFQSTFALLFSRAYLIVLLIRDICVLYFKPAPQKIISMHMSA